MSIRWCHYCSRLAVRRSQRRGLLEVLILPVFLLRPFRCMKCQRRHYGSLLNRRSPTQPKEQEGAAVSLRVCVVAALLALQLLAGGSVLRSQTREQQALGALRAAGEVYVNGSPVTGELTLFTGDTVRTGADGVAGLTVPGRGTLIISRQTEISFVANPRYFASLRQGTIGLRSLVDARNFQIQIGGFVVAPVAEAEAAAEIERAADGSAGVSCNVGSVGVIALEGPESIFVRAGQAVNISPEGKFIPLAPRPPTPPAPAPPTKPTPAPPVVKKRKTGYIVLGVVGGAAAGAAAALAGRGGPKPVSPSVP